ncbi:MAG: transketolase family protein [Lachnospiraceae bacterium]|nr:transketolase family protein [Lachnospiraceae bacterium]
MPFEVGKKAATRDAYGKALLELGRLHTDVVALDADLADSTRSGFFKKEFPDRFFDCGIAEANMAGISAGLASCGKTPFMSSFAMFTSGRNYEQIRNSIAYPALNVKIGASHAGITVGEDGATHQCLEDISLMRTLPNMKVICPSDAAEAYKAVMAAYDIEGPVYLRLSRFSTVIAHDDSYEFHLGKGEVLKDGDDLTIVATGLPVPSAVEAARELENEGISVRVINMASIKPIDKELLIKAALETKRILTVEEHWITGGLGSAVLEAISEDAPVWVKRLGIPDVFGESGPAAELVAKFGLDKEGIKKSVKDFLNS